MERAHTALSKAAAVLMGVLALVHLVTGATAHDAPAYARVLVLSTCVVSVVATVLLVRETCCTSRLVALGAALVSVAGAALVAGPGLPGGAPEGMHATGIGVLGLGVLTTLLLLADARAERPAPAEVSPYAL